MAEQTTGYASLSKRELIEELTAADERIDELESGIASLLETDDDSNEDDDEEE